MLNVLYIDRGRTADTASTHSHTTIAVHTAPMSTTHLPTTTSCSTAPMRELCTSPFHWGGQGKSRGGSSNAELGDTCVIFQIHVYFFKFKANHASQQDFVNIFKMLIPSKNMNIRLIVQAGSIWYTRLYLFLQTGSHAISYAIEKQFRRLTSRTSAAALT